MNPFTKFLLFTASLVIIFVGKSAAQITSAAIESPIHIDGSLLEKAWSDAQVISDFYSNARAERGGRTHREYRDTDYP